MNCKKCGSLLEPNAVSCKVCGTPVDTLVPGTPGVVPVSTPVAPMQPTNGMPVQQAPMQQMNTMNGVSQSIPTQPMSPVQPQGIPMQQMNTMNGMPPMGTTPMMNGQVPSNGKKSNKILIIIAVIVVLAAVAVVLYFTVFKKDNKSGKSSNTNTNTNTQSNSNIVSNSNSNSNIPTPSTTGNEVEYDGFTYTIPSEYEYEITDEGVFMFGNDDIVFSIASSSDQYEVMLANLDLLKNQFITAGYSNVSIKEQNVNGKSYIILYLTNDAHNLIVGYTKANANLVFGFEIHMADNTYGIQYLNTIDKVLKNAVYIGQ